MTFGRYRVEPLLILARQCRALGKNEIAAAIAEHHMIGRLVRTRRQVAIQITVRNTVSIIRRRRRRFQVGLERKLVIVVGWQLLLLHFGRRRRQAAVGTNELMSA